ncbi:MAG TPA: hypothetical protein VL727_07365 [Puia sp.]|jgi:hypothetical protein|nr:hypothetical protein [Puia sp.]
MRNKHLISLVLLSAVSARAFSQDQFRNHATSGNSAETCIGCGTVVVDCAAVPPQGRLEIKAKAGEANYFYSFDASDTIRRFPRKISLKPGEYTWIFRDPTAVRSQGTLAVKKQESSELHL